MAVRFDRWVSKLNQYQELHTKNFFFPRCDKKENVDISRQSSRRFFLPFFLQENREQKRETKQNETFTILNFVRFWIFYMKKQYNILIFLSLAKKNPNKNVYLREISACLPFQVYNAKARPRITHENLIILDPVYFQNLLRKFRHDSHDMDFSPQKTK